MLFMKIYLSIWILAFVSIFPLIQWGNTGGKIRQFVGSTVGIILGSFVVVVPLWCVYGIWFL